MKLIVVYDISLISLQRTCNLTKVVKSIPYYLGRPIIGTKIPTETYNDKIRENVWSNQCSQFCTVLAGTAVIYQTSISLWTGTETHTETYHPKYGAVPGCLGNTELYFGFQPVNVYQAGIKHLSFVNFCERGGLFCNSFTETG